MIRETLLQHLYSYALEKGLSCNVILGGIYLKQSGWFIVIVKDVGCVTAWKRLYEHSDLIFMQIGDPNTIKVLESVIDGYASSC